MLARMIRSLARGVSLIGHPLLLLPVAALALMAARGASDGTLLRVAAVFVGLAAMLLLWSHRQVTRRRWAHIDASAPAERRTLNLALLAVLAACTGLAWLRGMPVLALGAALAGAMVLLALLLRAHCTLSLHLAFASYAAGLAWAASPVLGAVFAVLAASVAWSRLHLARHTPRDLLAGGFAGAAAAACFAWLAPGLGAVA